MLEMLFITFVSTLTLLPIHKDENSNQKIFNSLISVCYISPSILNNEIVSYIIIGSILILIFLLIGYTTYLGWSIKKDNIPFSPDFLKPWIILQRLLLPIPGYIIGSYLGYYFVKLTTTIYLGQLILTVTAGIFWCWSVVSSSILYNSNQFKRKNDICQIRPNYILFDCFVTTFPMLQAMIPYIISVFISSPSKSIINVGITSAFSIFAFVFIIINHPYYNDSMNQNVIFLSLIKVPLSFIRIVEQEFPNNFDAYLLFCFLFMIAAFALIKIIPKCNSYHQATPLSPIKSNQELNNLNTENKDQEIPLDSSKDISSQSIIYDPFIDWAYPFNLISLTYQDIILIIYLFTALLTMTLSNGLAAQRIPISNALPDLIQDHFFVADNLRENLASSPFQISNVVVLIQIFLLIVFFLTVPQYLNVRRFVFIYSTLCLIRSVSFAITSLPAPCAGSPKCPCADPEVIKRFREGNPAKIAMTWLFGLGMFLKYPQCGDLIISGHTMWLWLTSRTLCSVMEYTIPRPFNWLSNTLLIVLTLIAMGYIVLSKNHYSIDVWFAFLLTELLYNFYNSLAENSIQPQRPTWTVCQKIIKYFETRPPNRVLMQTKLMMQYNE